MQDQVQDEQNDSSEVLYERLHIVVDKGQEPMRIDKFVVARMEGASRTKVQKAIEAGMVTINGTTVSATYKIRPSEEITVFSEYEPHGEEIVPQQMDLNIQYEDDD